MSIATANLNRLMKQLDLEELRVKGEITKTYKKLLKEIFVDIVTHTPQFSGNLVHGWQIVHGPYSANEYTLATTGERNQLVNAAKKNQFDPFEQGDDPGVSMVLDRELPKLDSVRWNTRVKFVNTVDYAEEVDKTIGPNGRAIRPENLNYGVVFMASRAEIKYGKLKNILKVIAK